MVQSLEVSGRAQEINNSLVLTSCVCGCPRHDYSAKLGRLKVILQRSRWLPGIVIAAALFALEPERVRPQCALLAPSRI